MTVKDLKEQIKNLPDNMIVIMSKDSEGNRFSPLSQVDSDNNVYQAETTSYGEVGLKSFTPKFIKEGYTNEDIIKGEVCIVLWPIN